MLGEAFVVTTVFISHSREDRRFLNDVLLPLMVKGGIRYFMPPRGDQISEEYVDRIRADLAESDWLVVILTRASIRSKWVPWALCLVTVMTAGGRCCWVR